MKHRNYYILAKYIRMKHLIGKFSKIYINIYISFYININIYIHIYTNYRINRRKKTLMRFEILAYESEVRMGLLGIRRRRIVECSAPIESFLVNYYLATTSQPNA